MRTFSRNSTVTERYHRHRQGFALIATISVMALLVMVALAMLSLSTIELRTSRQGKSMAEAQANARMALMIALGELQKHAGPDQRVTVPATQWDTLPGSAKIDGVEHSKLLAIYKSRTMEDEMANSLPSNYYSRSENFLTWLVSHSDPSQLLNPDFAKNGSFKNEVALTPHSDGKLTLRADKVPVSKGALAWGITDESMKYSLRERQKTTNSAGSTTADVLARSGLPGTQGHEIISNLSNLDKDGTDVSKYITPEQIALIEDITGDFEDLDAYLTPHSLSLLTDVKKGGFRSCLNLLLEVEEGDLPAEYLNMESYSSRWGGNRLLNQRRFSDSEITGVSTSSDYDTMPVALLQRYYQTARMGTGSTTHNTNDSTRVTLNAAGRARHDVISYSIDSSADRYWDGYGHSLRLVPVITRCRDIVYVTATPKPGDPSKLQLKFISYPVVTMWNPYNVDVEMPIAWCRNRGHALEARVTVGASIIERRVGGGTNHQYGSAGGQPSLSFSPGETKVLFPDFSASPSYSNIIFTNEWPADMSLLKKFTAGDFGVEGSATTVVNIDLVAANDFFNSTWKSSQHFDGWTSSVGAYQATKFQNWAFKLDAYRGLLKGGEDVLQSKTLGSLRDTPWPLAILEVGSKSADHPEQPGSLWTFDYPHRMNINPHYAAANEDIKGGFQAAPMQYTFTPLRGETDLSKHLSVMDDAAGMHDIMGYSSNPSRGTSYLTMCELPFVPLHSLGQLQHLPLQDTGWFHDSIHPHTPTWTFGLGNSWAHPWLSSSQMSETRPFALMAKGDDVNTVKGNVAMVERLWCANSVMWDSFTFTTMAPQDTPWFKTAGNSRGLKDVYNDFFSASLPLPNNRLVPWPGTDADELETRLLSSSKPTQDAHKIFPAHVGLLGGINVNNTSVEVWKLVLASTLKAKIPTQSHLPGSSMKVTNTDRYFASRYTQPTGPSIDNGDGDAYVNGFNGYRELSKTQIEELAEAIVVEIKERGPFRSLAEFVNRQRTSSSSDAKAIYGALQAALEADSVSINHDYRGETFKSSDFPDASFTNKAALDGPDGSGFPRARGIPGYVTQADLLVPLASVITARGDTFTIHAYGEAHDASGKVIARARCKAAVQRCPVFIDSADESVTALVSLTQEVNKTFGRKFKIVSFQWVSEKNIISS